MVHLESFQRIKDADITSDKLIAMFRELTNAMVNLAHEHPGEIEVPTIILNWTEEDDIEMGTLVPVLTFSIQPFDPEKMRQIEVKDA